MLRQHPDVRFSPLKEVHYFDVLYLGMGREERMRAIRRSVDREIERLDGASDPSARDRRAWLLRVKEESFVFTDASYRYLLEADEGAVTGDITVLLCAAGPRHRAPPATRSSGATDLHDTGANREGPLIASLWHNKRPFAGRVFASKRFLARGDYRTNIPRWESHFDPEQILYLPFGDLKARPLDILRKVEGHIGVASFDGYRRTEAAVNTSGGIEAVITDELAQKVAEVFAGQREYLKRRFGSDFVSRIS